MRSLFSFILTLIIAFASAGLFYSSSATAFEESLLITTEKKPAAAKAITQLNIGVLYSAKGHRGLFREISAAFAQQYPNIKLRFIGKLDAEYKRSAQQWLMGNGEIDVMYWQGGERLLHYARQGRIYSLNGVWQQEQLTDKFPKTILDVVSVNNEIFGMPFAYYTWGMFYNTKVLEKLKLSAPTQWQELKNLCQAASEQKMTPIMLSSKEVWSPAAWFDYINLRLNGLSFHLDLLKGKESYLDERSLNALTHWKELIEANCFSKNHKNITWQGLFPPLLRQMAASVLIANFVDSAVPQQFQHTLIYKPFPQINPAVPNYEDVPVDAFVILQSSKKKSAAEKFIAFIAQPQIQGAISNATGQSAPHRDAIEPSGYFAKQNISLLAQSKGLAQYFDRDVRQEMANESLNILIRFIDSGDVLATAEALEQLRLQTVVKHRAL